MEEKNVRSAVRMIKALGKVEGVIVSASSRSNAFCMTSCPVESRVMDLISPARSGWDATTALYIVVKVTSASLTKRQVNHRQPRVGNSCTNWYGVIRCFSSYYTKSVVYPWYEHNCVQRLGYAPNGPCSV